eukprot:82925_1
MAFLPTPSNGKNDIQICQKYQTLDQCGRIQVEYIWIGGSGMDIRAKTRVLKKKVNDVSEIPCWNYDGSSTGQADGSYSEIWLQPVKICRDPFRGGDNILCLCETLNAKDMKPTGTNNRHDAAKIFEHKEVSEQEPWYGIEQEYTLLGEFNRTPLGWPTNGFPAPQGPYYCSVGTTFAYGRQVAEAHCKACLFAGLDISGINAEVMPGQWEFQVGPSVGIDSGDQMWLARYILNRVGEDFNVNVSYDPKPIQGDWNGAGCHTNYSTKAMREEGGYKFILDACKKLGKHHKDHMAVYGRHNQLRLTGKHETADFRNFRYGVADRGASIRIPRQTEIDQKGYLEDRRPAANMDPYVVTAMVAKTTLIVEDASKPALSAMFGNLAKQSTVMKLFDGDLDHVALD